MHNYFEKLTKKEMNEILKAIRSQKLTVKENGVDAHTWNNAINNVIDKLFNF